MYTLSSCNTLLLGSRRLGAGVIMSRTKSSGFTLVELMIVVAVVAILAMIALPSYTAQVRKSRRSDAISTMNTVILGQERWRTNCPNYAVFSDSTCGTTAFMAAPTSAYYTFSLSTPASPTGYILTATAQGAQAKDSQFGTSCATLTITNGTNQSPAACFGH